MANCTMCGLPVPEGQRVCSMCYGDPAYGRDGYYEEYLREQQRQHEVERQIAEQQQEEEPA